MNKSVLCAGLLLFSLGSLLAGRGTIKLCNNNDKKHKFKIGNKQMVIIADECVTIDLSYGKHKVGLVESIEDIHSGGRSFIIDENGKLRKGSPERRVSYITIENQDQIPHKFEIEHVLAEAFLSEKMVYKRSTINPGETFTFRQALNAQKYIIRLVDESKEIRLSQKKPHIVVHYKDKKSSEPFSIE